MIQFIPLLSTASFIPLWAWSLKSLPHVPPAHCKLCTLSPLEGLFATEWNLQQAQQKTPDNFAPLTQGPCYF